MGKHDKRVDAYIAKSPDFARPILAHIREVVHAACPPCEETLKWNTPTFTYNGKLMVGMAAFKQHCRLILWQGKHIPGAELDAIGKPQKVADLPSKRQLTSFIKQSMRLIESGVKIMDGTATFKPAVKPPAAFLAALKKNRKAAANFETFTPGKRREYVEWIAEAKREETRNKRIATAVEWIAEGKTRHWKHM